MTQNSKLWCCPKPRGLWEPWPNLDIQLAQRHWSVIRLYQSSHHSLIAQSSDPHTGEEREEEKVKSRNKEKENWMFFC